MTQEGGTALTEEAPAATQTEAVSTEGVVAAVGEVAEAGTQTTEPAKEAEAASIINFPENWKEALAEELRNDPGLSTTHDIPTLAKNYVNLQKQMGGDKIIKPGKHATDNDWKDFWGKMGMPSKQEEYSVNLPEGHEFDDGFITKFKDWGFENGMLPQQAEKLLTAYYGWNKEALDAHSSEQKVEVEKQMSALKQEYGEAYSRKMSEIKNAVNEASSGMEESGLKTWLDNVEIEGVKAGNHPIMLKVFEYISNLLGEDSIPAGEAGSSVTPKELQKQANEIIGNLEHPYNNARHPNHKAAVEEVSGMFERMNPEA